jgi:hypothetical protein
MPTEEERAIALRLLEEANEAEGVLAEPDLQPGFEEPDRVNAEDRKLRKALLDRGYAESSLPKGLQDRVVAKSSRGAIGAIVQKRYSGIVPNAAAKTVKQFVKNIGGKEQTIQKLIAVEDRLTEEEKELLRLLQSGDKRTLVQLIVESGANPAKIIDNYARGAVILGKVDAATKAAVHMPKMINDLLRHALDHEDVCQRCVGVGKMPRVPSGITDAIPCDLCGGSGKITVISEHKEWAADKILQIGGVIEPKGGGATVNVGVNIDNGGPSFMSRQLEVSEAILHNSRMRPVDVEATVVPSENSSQE